MRRFLRMTLLLGYVLITCTLLSGKIEEAMTVRVTTKTVNLFQKPLLPASTLFWDDGGSHLYGLEEEEGALIVRELKAGDDYNINYEENSVKLSGTGECSVILSASRQPQVGEKAEVLQKRGQTQDRYLLVRETVQSPETQVQIWETDRGGSPFLEHEVKQSLGLEFPEDWRLYSLTDADTFVENVPRIALMLALLLLPVVLLTGSCILESRKALWCNIGLSVASCGGAWALLSSVKLPFSWLPPDNIFRLSYYREQMTGVLQALEQLGDAKMQIAWEQAYKTANWILFGTGLFALAVILAESILFRKSGNKRQQGKFWMF